jgi:uroporphyrinogen-III decarboxylase
MSRRRFLDLATSGAGFPIGSDLVLRDHADAEQILLDGRRLGGVIAAAAARYRMRLALPLMDLTLEKQWLLERLGIRDTELSKYHFTTPPMEEDVARVERRGEPNARLAANLDAIRFIACETDLVPVGMSIGPFSLATKMIADPISPVFLAGSGVSGDDEPEVALLERVFEMSVRTVLQSVALQLDAGATAIFIAEPAANLFYFSPNQLADGSDVFDRFAIAPNRRVNELLDRRGADLIFHCCGELVEPMVTAFASLEPAVLSLGSSRTLWEDARLVPKHVVLYGNVPSKDFYSDKLITVAQVRRQVAELRERMRAVGHPFIAGSECDVLHVDGDAAARIRAKAAAIAEA